MKPEIIERAESRVSSAYSYIADVDGMVIDTMHDAQVAINRLVDACRSLAGALNDILRDADPPAAAREDGSDAE